MKIIDCLNMQQTLTNIVNQKIAFSLAYKLSKLTKVVEDNLTYYYSSVRELLNEYGQKDENGELVEDGADSIKLIPERANEFYDKISELQNVEIADTIPIFTIEEFDDKIELTTIEFNSIMPIFSIEE